MLTRENTLVVIYFGQHSIFPELWAWDGFMASSCEMRLFAYGCIFRFLFSWPLPEPFLHESQLLALVCDILVGLRLVAAHAF